MVSVPVVVNAFDLSAAVTVIVIAAIIGCIVGYVFANIWNHAHRG
jgi:membrane protein DedA with SNARE-associated domain